MSKEIIKSQDSTISLKTLPTIWQALQVKVADTEKDAAWMNTPKLYEVAQQLGKDGPRVVLMLIKGMLADLLAFTGAEWTPAMIDSLLDLIKTNYGHLTLAQWKLFFVKAKSGKFAQEGQRENQTMIARLTPLIVSQWLANHSARCEEANEEYFAHQQRNLPERPMQGKYVASERINAAFEALIYEWVENVGLIEGERNEALKAKRKASHDKHEKLIREYCEAEGIDIEKLEQGVIHGDLLDRLRKAQNKAA